MTDEEIEKALNCCKKGSWDYCCNCPYIDVPDCGNAIIQDSIDYIEHLKDEIAGLTRDVEALKTDNDNLTRALEETNEEIKIVREETAKEILDELDKYLWDDIDCTSDFTGREHNATVKQLINIIKKKYSVEVKE